MTNAKLILIFAGLCGGDIISHFLFGTASWSECFRAALHQGAALLCVGLLK